MRVVAVTWRDLANPSAGGAEVLIDRLLTGLAARGHHVSLVCGGPLAEHDYETVNAGGTYTQYLRAPVICMARFAQSDVIIDVENGFPYFSPLWRRKPSLCLVHHVHSDQWHGHFPASIATICRVIEERVMPAVYRNRLFVAVSNSTAKELRSIGIPASHIRVIESGVDDAPHTSLPKSATPLFLSLNRLVPHKRTDLLLDAWEKVSQKIGGRLVIAGDGPEFAALCAHAASIPRVDVVGRISEDRKHRLLAEAWGIVSTSHHEGWGMSVMEAAAAGTPALAIDAPGIRDAIVDGVTGILVHARDDEIPSSLAEAWVALASDEALRDSLGRAARERATRFSWDTTIDRWQAVLEEVAGHPKESTVTTFAAPPTFLGGVRRSFRLFQGFRAQFEDADGFYTLLADDTVSLIKEHEPVAGRRVVDVGGGPGYFAEAFRRAGAQSTFVEPFWDSMTSAGRRLGYGVIGDGMRLPFADGAFDVSHSSNVLEHVTDPLAFFGEMIRVVRPGGLVFLAFTNWYSPFGGHETSPWHYLGGERAADRYERRLGHPAKNRYGVSLFPLHVRDVLRWARSQVGVELLDAFPRYYPRWTRQLIRVPGLREVATWNLALVMRRTTDVPPAHSGHP